MTAKIISGKEFAKQIIEEELIPRVKKLNKISIQPRLVVVLIGKNQASESYVKQKEKFAKEAGISSKLRRYPETISEAELIFEIEKINQDDTVHGMIVQLPLPKHIRVGKILETIDPKKDVDGFTAKNIGKLFLGVRSLECCTPKGIVKMLDKAGIKIEGANTTVLGKSNIVGKPVAALLMNRGATVTTCHSRTKDIDKNIKNADILIVAIGKPEFIKGSQISKGCAVIDVGIHKKENGKLCGDVEFEKALERASYISPVPGGVGPMTVVSLIENTIQAAENSV